MLIFIVTIAFDNLY